jgi:hypothetical protein
MPTSLRHCRLLSFYQQKNWTHSLQGDSSEAKPENLTSNIVNLSDKILKANVLSIAIIVTQRISHNRCFTRIKLKQNKIVISSNKRYLFYSQYFFIVAQSDTYLTKSPWTLLATYIYKWEGVCLQRDTQLQIRHATPTSAHGVYNPQL